jgi:hypothetical protein
MRKMTRLLVVAIVIMSMALAMPAMADEFGGGPAYIDGHSDDSTYGVNNQGKQSFGFGLHYDKDLGWVKEYNGGTKIGIDPGMFYIYARWTKNHNKERTVKEEWDYCKDDVCRPIPLYDDFQQYPTRTRTEEYQVNETINSHILGMYFKPYVELYSKVRFFALAGPALEIADDGTNTAAVVGGGIQYRFSKNFGASLTQYEVFSDPFSEYRRFDATVFSIDYIW